MDGIGERVIEQWTDGAAGIGGKLVELEGLRPERAIAYLAAKGCGAWVGRTGCGDEPVGVLVGHRAAFLAYRTLVLTVVAVCERHGPHLLDLVRDLPEDLRRAEEREYRTWCRQVGASVERGAAFVPLPVALTLRVGGSPFGRG